MSRLIGPEGGELVSADGALSILVPEGALDEPVTLSCENLEAEAGTVGDVYDLGPNGQQFLRDVTLQFKVPSGEDPETLEPATQSGQRWRPLTGVSRSREHVSGETLHFSRFALVSASDAGADDGGEQPQEDAGEMDSGTDADLGDGGDVEGDAAQDGGADAAEDDDAGDAMVDDAGAQGGLMAWYRFEESSGTVVDSSGNGNDGVVMGTGTTQGAAGRIGNAITFNGSGYVVVPADSSLDFETGATVELWINLTSTSGVQSLVSRGTGNGDDLFGMNTDAGNLQAIFQRIEPQEVVSPTSSVGLFSATTWTHIAVVNDGADYARVYINGEQVIMTAGGGLTPIPSDLYIGRREPAVFSLIGSVDEIKWWNVTRTEDEICEDAGGTVVGGTCQLN